MIDDDDLSVSLPSEQISMVNIPNLHRGAPRGSISDSPRSLLPCAELSLLKDLNQDWEDVGVNHILKRGNYISYTEQQPFFRHNTLNPCKAVFT